MKKQHSWHAGHLMETHLPAATSLFANSTTLPQSQCKRHVGNCFQSNRNLAICKPDHHVKVAVDGRVRVNAIQFACEEESNSIYTLPRRPSYQEDKQIFTMRPIQKELDVSVHSFSCFQTTSIKKEHS